MRKNSQNFNFSRLAAFKTLNLSKNKNILFFCLNVIVSKNSTGPIQYLYRENYSDTADTCLYKAYTGPISVCLLRTCRKFKLCIEETLEKRYGSLANAIGLKKKEMSLQQYLAKLLDAGQKPSILIDKLKV